MPRTPYIPGENQRKLIAQLMEIISKNGYLLSPLPPIFISYEPPPIFVKYPGSEENPGKSPDIISIEEWLGVYRPRPEEIVIYERGIQWRGHRFDEEQLFNVVLIHEIAHWITHKLYQPGLSAWKTDLYVWGEVDVHEGWAQLMTWWIANQVKGEFKHTFKTLNRNQSPPYRVFERFKSVPINRVMASLGRLRSLSSPVRLQDWEEAMGYAEWMAFAVWNDFLRTMLDAGMTMEEIWGFQEVRDFVDTEWKKFAEWGECVECALGYGFTAEQLQKHPAFTSPKIKDGL